MTKSKGTGRGGARPRSGPKPKPVIPLPDVDPKPRLDPGAVARRVLLAMAVGSIPATTARVAACLATIRLSPRPQDDQRQGVDPAPDSWDAVLN
jgi:hypothetical protein